MWFAAGGAVAERQRSAAAEVAVTGCLAADARGQSGKVGRQVSALIAST